MDTRFRSDEFAAELADAGVEVGLVAALDGITYSSMSDDEREAYSGRVEFMVGMGRDQHKTVVINTAEEGACGDS